jgi:hypothetical protein
MSSIALRWEAEPSQPLGFAVSHLAAAALAVGAIFLALPGLRASNWAEPSAASVRFSSARSTEAAVATSLDLSGVAWLNHAAPQAPKSPLASFLAAVVLPAQLEIEELPAENGEPGDAQEPLPISVQVTDLAIGTTCSVVADEVALLATTSSQTCATPGPQSAFAPDGGGSPDMTKCSAVVTTTTTEENNGTCSTVGITNDKGKGACSAHGADPERNMDDTKMGTCSTSGGGEGGKGAIVVCSAQQGEKTQGGGCSAGSLKADDPRASANCSVLDGSKDGSTCSINGDTTNPEMDCSAGNNQQGKSSECSTYSKGGDAKGPGKDSFCSAKAGSGGGTKGACSAWDMENPEGSGKSGDAKCSVIGSGPGTCSVKGSSGGGQGGDGGVDGFCSSGVGSDNKPGSGKAECSVLPGEGGKPAGQCSAFKPDGSAYPGMPDKNGNCFLPK